MKKAVAQQELVRQLRLVEATPDQLRQANDSVIEKWWTEFSDLENLKVHCRKS